MVRSSMLGWAQLGVGLQALGDRLARLTPWGSVLHGVAGQCIRVGLGHGLCVGVLSLVSRLVLSLWSMVSSGLIFLSAT